ncbi:MAG: ATP-binding protein, partial [Bacillota bacterium]
MDEVTLRSLVARGEGEQLEFKRGTAEFSDLAEEVVCLANHRGGWVLLGVDDRGRITGCDHDVGLLKRAIFDSTQP